MVQVRRRDSISRPFRQGIFIRDYLLGLNPQGSAGNIDPNVGAPQVDFRFELKEALRRATADDIIGKIEQKRIAAGESVFSVEERDTLMQTALKQIPFNQTANRFQSFVRYFNRVKRLGWVESTGKTETSAVQSQNPAFGSPRIFYRLTNEGRSASEDDWSNPFRAPLPEGTTPAIPTSVPTISLPDRFSSRSLPRLTAHIETLQEIAERTNWPETPFTALGEEVERIRNAAEEWEQQSQESLDNEEERDSPREERVDALTERIDSLRELQEALDSQDLSGALSALGNF